MFRSIDNKILVAKSGRPLRAVGDGESGSSLEWISTAQLTADAALLVGQLPPNISGVAGIPRSGLIPATAVATHLHVPLWELAEDGGLRRLGHGSRGRNLGFAGDPSGPLVVIDDTAYSGAAMVRAREQLRGHKAFFAAVYVRPDAAWTVDFYARLLPCPHLLEWNLMNNCPFAGLANTTLFRGGVATDLDGILCRDPDLADSDDGGNEERYRRWLENAPPLWLPRLFPAPLIVTGRIERWRPETEAWLRKWGVRWERLAMHPAETAKEREAADDIAHRKAEEYGRSGCGFFLESDPGQAELIFMLSGKPVICPRVAKVWS